MDKPERRGGYLLYDTFARGGKLSDIEHNSDLLLLQEYRLVLRKTGRLVLYQLLKFRNFTLGIIGVVVI